MNAKAQTIELTEAEALAVWSAVDTLYSEVSTTARFRRLTLSRSPSEKPKDDDAHATIEHENATVRGYAFTDADDIDVGSSITAKRQHTAPESCRTRQ